MNLEDVLFSKSRQVVLALLLGHPDEKFYLRHIVRLTGLAVGQVQNEVKRLSGGGVIERFVEGRHVYFRANTQCPVFAELRSIVAKTSGVAGILQEVMKPLVRRVRGAFVFGSVANLAENSQSDVDLLVVGDVSFAEVVSAIRKAEAKLNRAVNPLVMTEAEFSRKISEGRGFVTSVSQGRKIWICGTPDSLGLHA